MTSSIWTVYAPDDATVWHCDTEAEAYAMTNRLNDRDNINPASMSKYYASNEHACGDNFWSDHLKMCVSIPS